MSGWIATAQGAVNGWECNHMGHMNVQLYVGRIADGASHLRASLARLRGGARGYAKVKAT